jgi:ABC-type branched-subunit amino acid transport system substrate-binding protein
MSPLRRHVLIYCLIGIALLGFGAAQNVLRIGASLSLTPPTTNRAITGIGIMKGLQLFTKWANERGPMTIGNQTYTWELVVLDDKGNSSILVSNYQKLHANSSINFLVGPVASDFNILAATRVTEPAGRVLVAYAFR